MEDSSGFVPLSGFTSEWLKKLFRTHVSRSRAVGKDGTTLAAFAANLDAECELIAKKVNEGRYTFTPYREKLIARGAHRCPRQISIPTIRDRLALRGALEYLKMAFPTAQPRPPHLYIKEIKAHLRSVREHSSFLRMDIRDFYPTLQHDLLNAALQASSIPTSVTDLIIKAVGTPTGSDQKCKPCIGVPQGLSISNALSAIYMIDFDKKSSSNLFYRRYVDDILVIDSSESIISSYKSLWDGLNQLGLKSHPMGTIGKTEVNGLGEGVQYLGYQISPEKVSIRKSSLAKMFSNLAKVLTCFKYKRDNEKHLFRLNLKISGCIINNSRRGWLMFFSQTDDVSQLSFLDRWLRDEIKALNVGLGDVKSFKKSYYEIRYNLEKTTYIPNFDNYNFEQKRDVVRILSKRSEAQLAVMDAQMIEYEFGKLIGREISELERDLVDAFS